VLVLSGLGHDFTLVIGPIIHSKFGKRQVSNQTNQILCVNTWTAKPEKEGTKYSLTSFTNKLKHFNEYG